MYEITTEQVIHGDIATIWAIVSDVAGWPRWDPHEQAARLDGDFAPGAAGWSKPNGGPATDWTITEVEAPYRWASECALPGGRLTGVTTFEPLPDGRVRCRKTVRVYGPLVPLFRLYFGRRIRRDQSRTFAALEHEATARTFATA